MKKIILRSLLVLALAIVAILIYAVWVFFPLRSFLPLLTQQQNILITLHNNAELRPTLGFLTGFFIVQGTPSPYRFSFADSYAVNPPSPPIVAPEILEKRFGSTAEWKGWTFRDSNMDLWFPENAQHAMRLLSYDPQFSSISFDNVIGIDMYAIEQIINTLGGISHQGTTIQGENLFQILESQSKDFIPTTSEQWLKRKSGISSLGKSLIRSILLRPWKWDDLTDTTILLLQQKHILIFSTDINVQKKWESKNWAGHNSIAENEIPWGVNIANIGGKKSDRYIQKKIQSRISIDEKGKIQESISLTFFHNGTRNIHSDRYFAHVRLIKPKGTHIISATGDYEYTPQESKDGIISFFFWMDESSEKTFKISLQYPDEIEASFFTPMQWHFIPHPGEIHPDYDIVFQGTADTSFDITGIDHKNTENISSLSIPHHESRISVQWKEDSTPPLLEEMLWKDNRKVLRVQFSEYIQPIKKENIQIQLNANPYIPIKIQHEPRAIEIYFNDHVPFASTEKYIIKIFHVSDLFDNTKDIIWSIR